MVRRIEHRYFDHVNHDGSRWYAYGEDEDIESWSVPNPAGPSQVLKTFLGDLDASTLVLGYVDGSSIEFKIEEKS